MTDAGGSNLQVQWNNAGVLDGMAGTIWDATNQRLSITEAPSVYGAGALSITKGAGSSSVLDLLTDYSGKVLRILLPPDQSTLSPVTYIGNGGEIATRAWMTISGSTSGSGDTYVINAPLSSSYATMANIWADVPYTLVLRTFNANGGYNITALDRNANFRFMMPEDGSLTWGPSTASTPSGIDTGLSRIGAASMAFGNGTAGDYSGAVKLTTLTFADGTAQTTAATSSGVSGLVIAPGKSLTVNSIVTLAGADNKTLTVNNSISFTGVDGTTMTLPSSNATLAALNITQTFTATQTFSNSLNIVGGSGFNLTLDNQSALRAKSTSGTAYNVFQIDSGNNTIYSVGSLPGNVVFFAPVGMQIRFLNNNGANRILSLLESTQQIILGPSTSFDSTVTINDARATTGDTVLSIRAGAAREARVRFGSSAGAYDVGLQRDAAGGILNVTDASASATNYRGLRARDLMVNGSSSLGGGVGVIAIANASTPPTSNPAGGGILYVANGALMYRGASGTVTTLANA